MILRREFDLAGGFKCTGRFAVFFFTGAFAVVAVCGVLAAGAAGVVAAGVLVAGVCWAWAFPISIIPETKEFAAIIVNFRMMPFSHGSTGFAKRR